MTFCGLITPTPQFSKIIVGNYELWLVTLTLLKDQS